jgi:hypothetical protein
LLRECVRLSRFNRKSVALRGEVLRNGRSATCIQQTSDDTPDGGRILGGYDVLEIAPANAKIEA